MGNNIFEASKKKIEEKKEPVKVIKATKEITEESYTDYKELISGTLERKVAGKNKCIYLSHESLKLLREYCADTGLKASNVVDNMIKHFLGN